MTPWVYFMSSLKMPCDWPISYFTQNWLVFGVVIIMTVFQKRVPGYLCFIVSQKHNFISRGQWAIYKKLCVFATSSNKRDTYIYFISPVITLLSAKKNEKTFFCRLGVISVPHIAVLTLPNKSPSLGLKTFSNPCSVCLKKCLVFAIYCLSKK